MKKTTSALLLLTLGGLFSSPILAAEEEKKDFYIGMPDAEMLANTCAGCHGSMGSSFGPASPSLAEISKAYFIDSMAAYKSGERPSTIMTRIAKGYTDEEIEAMAGYFSKQKMTRIDQPYDKGLASEGKKHHKKYCEKCHEDGGRSSEDDAGILAGQMMPYLEYTMADFTSGKREMEKKMKKKVEQLQEEQGEAGLKALINYYGSQK